MKFICERCEFFFHFSFGRFFAILSSSAIVMGSCRSVFNLSSTSLLLFLESAELETFVAVIELVEMWYNLNCTQCSILKTKKSKMRFSVAKLHPSWIQLWTEVVNCLTSSASLRSSATSFTCPPIFIWWRTQFCNLHDFFNSSFFCRQLERDRVFLERFNYVSCFEVFLCEFGEISRPQIDRRNRLESQQVYQGARMKQ